MHNKYLKIFKKIIELKENINKGEENLHHIRANEYFYVYIYKQVLLYFPSQLSQRAYIEIFDTNNFCILDFFNILGRLLYD